MDAAARRAQIQQARAQQQESWMEQRRLEEDRRQVLQTSSPPVGRGGGGGQDRAVLDRLTERISDRLRSEIRDELEREATEMEQSRAAGRSDAADRVERHLMGEMASQTCPICMELMLSPRTPMLLFPCGHTFCTQCIESSMSAKGGAGRNKCPYCRATIESKAPNITLQHLVRSFVEKRSAVATDPSSEASPRSTSRGDAEGGLGVPASEAARHRREYRLLDMRWKILRNERADIAMEAEVVGGKEAAALLALEKFVAEEARIQDRLASLRAELELVQRHQRQQQQRLDDSRDERALCVQRMNLIDEALLPLGMEKEKQVTLQATLYQLSTIYSG